MSSSGAGSGTDVVFLSYSHADREWMRRLTVLLAPVVRNRRLEVWADEHIQLGDEWRRDIFSAVSRARLAVCLVTRDYLASRFIVEEELPALRAAGVRVVPVLVHDCLWEEEPYLAGVQWALDPHRDGPLDLHNERDGERDRRLTALCRRVLELLPSWDVPPRGSGNGDGTGRTRASEVSPLRVVGRGPGRVDGVPMLPPGYVARDEFDDIRAAVLGNHVAVVGVTGQVSGVGLAGEGGIGKTVLATALARNPQVASSFPDGVFWVGLGEDADPLAAQLNLLARLGVTGTDVRSVTQAARALREVLADRQCLLIVDDVWSAASAKALAVTGPRGRVLYTTRDAGILAPLGAQIELVDVLSENLARRFLAQLSGTAVEQLPAEVDRVLAGTGRLALALALVGAAVRGGSSWAQVAAELNRGERVFGAHPYANTFKALQLALASLDASARELYLSLAVFPRDTAIPLTTVARYWQRLRGDTPEQTLAQLREFAVRQLLNFEVAEISFHDLQHNYLLLQVDGLELLHIDLLATYRDSLPAGGQWWQLPEGEPYLWGQLIHHLHGAGNITELARTVTDPAYLITRTFLHGPAAAEADLRRAEGLLAHPDHGWWQRWFGYYGHLIAGLPTLSDTAVTAALWLTDAPHGVEAQRLTPLQSPPYFVSLWGLPIAPQNLRRVLTGHEDSVCAVAFSPDGQLLASASWDGTVRVWEADSGAARIVLTGHQGWVTAVMFSPDGQLLATVGADATVRVWDADSGVARTVLTAHQGGVSVVAVSPDSRLLASAGGDATVRVWEAGSGIERTVFTGHQGGVTAVMFSPDGRLLASADHEGTVRVWEASSGTECIVLTGHQGWVTAVAFSPDGQLLASAGRDSTVRVWETGSWAARAVLTGHQDGVTAVVFSPDSQLLASAGGDSLVRVWETGSGATFAAFTGHRSWVTAVAFSPDGQLLASAGWDSTVRVWEVDSGVARAVFTGHQGWVTAVAFSPDGQLLASAGGDSTVRVWEADIRIEHAVFTGPQGGVTAVAFSPDGQLLASADDDGTVRVWQAGSGTERAVFTGHQGGVTAVAFSPDGLLASAGWDATLRVSSAGWDSTVRVWDAGSGTERAMFTGHQGGVSAVAFSPDGQLLASADDDGTVRVWQAGSGTERAVFTGHQGGVTAVAFSPDGQLLATAGGDSTVRVWQADSGTERTVFTGHQGGVSAVAFSPDGQLLASASWDSTVRVWEAGSGIERTVFTGHQGGVTAVAFSPDGQLLASASDDGTVRIWGQDTLIKAMKLGLQVIDLCWKGDLLGLVVDRSVVVLRVTPHLPADLGGAQPGQ